MDVGAVLVRARAAAQLSQKGLAREAGTSRAMLGAYESGAKSPTVRQLALLLAACGLQLRPVLEPLLAHVDERVDAMLRDVVDPKADQLGRLADSLTKGGVRWAVDGPTALALQGLAVTHLFPCVVVAHDDRLQHWLRATMAKGYDEQLSRAYWSSWLDADLETCQTYLGTGVFTIAGFVTLRVVAELPATVAMAVDREGESLVVAALPVHEVEASHPALAEQLARWRLRTT